MRRTVKWVACGRLSNITKNDLFSILPVTLTGREADRGETKLTQRGTCERMLARRSHLGRLGTCEWPSMESHAEMQAFWYGRPALQSYQSRVGTRELASLSWRVAFLSLVFVAAVRP